MLAGWLVGWLAVGWLAGWLVYRCPLAFGWMACLQFAGWAWAGWLVAWLLSAEWMVGRLLVGWLAVDWSTHVRWLAGC